jgi:hypothetical protein
VRAVTRAWLDVIEAQRSEAVVALSRRVGSELLSPAAQTLLTTLGRIAQAARADGAGWLGAGDDVGLLAAAAAVEALSRRHLLSTPLRDAQRTLSDTISKLLR